MWLRAPDQIVKWIGLRTVELRGIPRIVNCDNGSVWVFGKDGFLGGGSRHEVAWDDS